MKKRRDRTPLWRLEGFFWACVTLVVGLAYLACAAPPGEGGTYFGMACMVGLVGFVSGLADMEGDDSPPW